MLVGDQESFGHWCITSEDAFNRAGRASAGLAEERGSALFGFCRTFVASGASGWNRRQERDDNACEPKEGQRARDDIAPPECIEQDKTCGNEHS